MGWFDHLPTLEEMHRTRRAMPKATLPTRKAVKTQKAVTAKAQRTVVRAQAVTKAGHRCEMCHTWLGTHGEAHHKVKRSQGGKWTDGNIKYLCRACHQNVHAGKR